MRVKFLGMTEQDFSELCKKHGVAVSSVRKNLRTSRITEAKSAIVIELRDVHDLKYAEIADLMGYFDRSGARQAYLYAKQLLKK